MPLNPFKTAPPAVRPISVALQGGGSHGAFEWGVLDRLLEDETVDNSKIAVKLLIALFVLGAVFGLVGLVLGSKVGAGAGGSAGGTCSAASSAVASVPP